MKKILLINQGNTTNYGDIAIKTTIETLLKEKNINTDFCPFWDDKIIYKKKKNLFTKVFFHIPFFLDCLYKYRMKSFMKNIEVYDAIVIGGGELLCGHRGFNTALFVWTKLAKRFQKKVYVIGVSGDLKMPNALIKRNYKSLSNIEYINVRDKKSYDIVKERYNKDVKYYPDVVFAYNIIMKKEKNNDLDTKMKNNTLCIPIRYSNQINEGLGLNTKEEYFNYLKKLIEKNEKNQNIIITSTVNIDEETAEEFYTFLKKNDKNYRITYKKYTNIEEYFKLVSMSNFIISGRMHALILGLINDCEVMTTPFKVKLKTFKYEYEGKKIDKKICRDAYEGLIDVINRINEGENNG